MCVHRERIQSLDKPGPLCHALNITFAPEVDPLASYGKLPPGALGMVAQVLLPSRILLTWHRQQMGNQVDGECLGSCCQGDEVREERKSREVLGDNRK